MIKTPNFSLRTRRVKTDRKILATVRRIFCLMCQRNSGWDIGWLFSGSEFPPRHFNRNLIAAIPEKYRRVRCCENFSVFADNWWFPVEGDNETTWTKCVWERTISDSGGRFGNFDHFIGVGRDAGDSTRGLKQKQWCCSCAPAPTSA